MRKVLLPIIIIFFASIGLLAQKSFLRYSELRDFQQASPGAFKFGLYGFDNPAILSYLHSPDFLLTFSERNRIDDKIKRWGLFYGGPFSGFGLLSQGDTNHSVIDYRYSLAFGDRNISVGLGYGFVGGDKSYFKRGNTVSLGVLWRPFQYLSIAGMQTYSLEYYDNETVLELATRPIPDYPLAFFGDIAWCDNQSLKEADWSAGISWEIVDGIRINSRYFSSRQVAIGVDISFGNFGVNSQANFDNKSNHLYNSYSFRFGALDRSFLKWIIPEKKYLKLDLSQPLKYQRFRLFDNSNALLEIIRTLDYAKEDKSIAGIAINVSGLNANMELLWEIREKLKEFKNYGKKVVIFIDRLSFAGYYFASVADKIVMDEYGVITLEGFVLGRSFYKNMLEKAGIGFDELRFFKYKSAVESFSREKMSEADKEQRQRLIDSWYETFQKDMCSARNFSRDEFEILVNDRIMYPCNLAKEKRLIDVIGRWADAKDIIKEQIEKFDDFIEFRKYKNENIASDYYSIFSDEEVENKPFDDKWGKPKDKIAVIYAIGECSMETGIKAKSLIKDMEKAFEDESIKAIVLRVDSPGGDVLASDYIANVIKKNKRKKPVVVSQGMVAGSGGYWLSMYGDYIITSPITITGSIGVISAWIYNKGLADSLGITTDFAKKGKYADLGFSFALPIIPIGLPMRPLTDEERKQFEVEIRELYRDFVQKVADARRASFDEIEKVAQGRVWTGADAMSIKLVDELGTLDYAIQKALSLAGIKDRSEVDIVEFPKPELFDWSAIFPSFLNVGISKEINVWESILTRLKNPAIPMPVMPLEFYDFVPQR